MAIKFHSCRTPSEVCDWCDAHSAFVIISITYRCDLEMCADNDFVIFYEDFSNYKTEHAAAHNIDRGIAIQTADALLQAVRCPSYVCSNKGPESSGSIY